MSEIENGLSKNKANYASLSPLSFLERTRKTFPNQIAIEYKDYKLTYQQAGERCEALAEFVRNKIVFPILIVPLTRITSIVFPTPSKFLTSKIIHLTFSLYVSFFIINF